MPVCTGCDRVFVKTHKLFNHRRTFRCGGEWNECILINPPDGVDPDTGEIYRRVEARYGRKYFPGCTLPDTSKSIRAELRRLERKRKHKCRTPGTIRQSRKPGGSGFRNNWEFGHVDA